MKNTTKGKILRWVEKILKYNNPNSPAYAPKENILVRREDREIIQLKCDEEMHRGYGDDILKKRACEHIVNELAKTGFVEFKIEDSEMNNGFIRVEATCFVIKPK